MGKFSRFPAMLHLHHPALQAMESHTLKQDRILANFWGVGGRGQTITAKITAK